MTAGSVVFLFVLVLATGFFSLNVQRLVSYLRLGYDEDRTDHPLTRLKNVLVIGIAQKKIFRDPVAGPMHALIFWGFMVLTAGTVEIVIAGVFPRFSFALVTSESRAEGNSSTPMTRPSNNASPTAPMPIASARWFALGNPADGAIVTR